MTVAGVGITADFVMAQASQVAGRCRQWQLVPYQSVINGIPIAVSGAPNQAISFPAARSLSTSKRFHPLAPPQ